MAETSKIVLLHPRTDAELARSLRVSSMLSSSFRDELERIVFFNPEQASITARLVDEIHRYGVPAIVEREGCLRFRVPAFGEVQTLYALDETEDVPRLVGVAMFTREAPSSLLVLHLAVHEDYTSRGRWAAVSVVGRLVAAIRDVGLRTHGVRRLRILYPRETRLAVREERGSRAGRPP